MPSEAAVKEEAGMTVNTQESGERKERLRLFYALWPDGETRNALARWQQSVRGRKVPAHNLHITLAFLGNQPASLLPVLKDVLDELPASRMLLELDQFGYFAKNRIAWAGMSVIPPELAELHAILNTRLKRLGIRHDERKRFTPHITLARDAHRPDAGQPEAIVWKADHVALVLSPMDGRPYRLLASKRSTGE